MHSARDALTPDALSMLQTIAEAGSFAAAARTMGMVASALTYRVRQMEEALDVLLFDRRSRQAKLTEAGVELLREGKRLLVDMDAVANRVKRVATGWEPQLTIAVDTIISRTVVLELCERFYALQPPTRLRLLEETLAGTLEALTSGQADLSIGVVAESAALYPNIQWKALGAIPFVYAVAPHHPLAQAPEPLRDETLRQHRAVAVADTSVHSNRLTFGLLAGQEVLTVPSMQIKLEAQLRGLGGGNLPLCMANRYIQTGRLVAKKTEHSSRQNQAHYAWRNNKGNALGKALQWWLAQLESPSTRTALLNHHASA